MEDLLREIARAHARELRANKGEVVYTYNLWDMLRGMCMPRMHELDRVHVSAVMEHLINTRGDDLLQGITHKDEEACYEIMTEAYELADAALLAAANNKGYPVPKDAANDVKLGYTCMC
jgi:hypothetical protein